MADTEQVNVDDAQTNSKVPTTEPAAAEASEPTQSTKTKDHPACVVLCIGMAGSGKTSLMQRVNAYLHQSETPCYVMNLDPAVHTVPFETNIDIRDTVNYKEVMKQYGLGPNGGIVTSLNLFATRFDQVLDILESRAKECDYVIVDTPGQIEVFTWSASGQIITESIAATLPTVVLYCIDTPRCTSPVTFMSNMLYACSILYKTKLPFILAFNKVDVVSHEFAMEWMTDYTALQDVIDEDTSYVSSLTRSMSMVLDEFYQNLRAVGVSAVTGAGMEDLFQAIDDAVQEYYQEYLPIVEQQRELKKQREAEEQKESLARLRKDLEEGGHVVLDVAAGATRVPPQERDSDDSDSDDESKELRPDDVHEAFMNAQGSAHASQNKATKERTKQSATKAKK